MKALDTSATIAAGPAAFGTKISPAAIAYAKDVRHISLATLERLGAGSGETFFPGRIQRRSEAVFFPYRLAGEVVNWKACAFPEKDFIGKKGGQLCFYNLEAVLASPAGDVWITEGEWDAAALVESGIDAGRVLSVPNGARERHKEADDKAEEDDKPNGYKFVLEALKLGLGKHKRFIWCGDMDAPGLALRQDMSRLFGAAKFAFVDWPEGCKDANDMLRSDGPEALKERVTDGTRPWPVNGLYALSEMPEPAPLTTWRVPCLPGWEGKVRFAPGTMSVVTGQPGNGKTAVFAQVWHDIAEEQGLVVAAATFETRAKPHFRRILRSLHMGKLEKDLDAIETAKADRWINDHYRFLVHPDQKPDLSWLMDMAEVAAVRHGVKVLQIDPWNRLESQRENRESETDYIGRCLTALYVFAQDMGVHVQVLAHPAKMDGQRKGKPPELEDISGSKHWENRVDQGFVVHRPKLFDEGKRCTEAIVFHKKARFEELGHPAKLMIDYDTTRGRFIDANSKSAEEAAPF